MVTQKFTHIYIENKKKCWIESGRKTELFFSRAHEEKLMLPMLPCYQCLQMA